jgi:hypothetical protein
VIAMPIARPARRHIRRKALDEAAAALEPTFKLKFPRHPRALKARAQR